jgi:hypothetical protein
MSALPIACPSSAVLLSASDVLPASLPRHCHDQTDCTDALLAAAARAASCPCVYGPLWGQRVAQRSKCRIELVVYDCFCMVFLDRPGNYYKVDQWARSARGDVYPDRIISSLRAYHRLLVTTRGAGALSRAELKAWWLMPSSTRRWVEERVVADSTAPYDYAYVPLLRRFLPQLMTKEVTWRFFDGLLLYVALYLSDDVELRVVTRLADQTALCYGVFAKRDLPAGLLKDIRGQLVPLTATEEAAVCAYGSDHSLLHMMRSDAHRTRVPDGVLDAAGERDRRAAGRVGKRQRTSLAPAATASTSTAAAKLVRFVVAGGISFLNNACAVHCNAWPCVWHGDDGVGAAQWQLATLQRPVRAGEELWLEYDDEAAAEGHDCMGCAQQR